MRDSSAIRRQGQKIVPIELERRMYLGLAPDVAFVVVSEVPLAPCSALGIAPPTDF